LKILKLGYTLSLLSPLERASTPLATTIVSRITLNITNWNYIDFWFP
jgi:hypothetical protein